jgi:hypothetical protein
MSLVFRVEASLSEVIPVGLVPEGVRLDAHFSGRVVEGPLSGATMRGVDYLLLCSMMTASRLSWRYWAGVP